MLRLRPIIRRWLELLARILHILVQGAALAGIVMTGLLVLSAFMRYVLGSPYRATEELVGLFFILMAFLTLPYCTVAGRQICINILSDRLRGKMRTASRIGHVLMTLTFAIVFGYLSFDYAAFSYVLGSTASMSGLLLWPWMAVMPLAAALLALTSLSQLVALLLGENTEVKDELPSDKLV